jgi:hypothetical protein
VTGEKIIMLLLEKIYSHRSFHTIDNNRLLFSQRRAHDVVRAKCPIAATAAG